MSDVGRKTVPDKGRLNREELVTKASEFPVFLEKKILLPLLLELNLQSFDNV